MSAWAFAKGLLLYSALVVGISVAALVVLLGLLAIACSRDDARRRQWEKETGHSVYQNPVIRDLWRCHRCERNISVGEPGRCPCAP